MVLAAARRPELAVLRPELAVGVDVEANVRRWEYLVGYCRHDGPTWDSNA